MSKKILNRSEFDKLRNKNLNKMSKDKSLFSNAVSLIQKADEHMFIHQNNYFGEPSINFPEDLIRIQEAIYKSKPDFIVEIGVAWGGTTLFLSSILESIGKGKVIGVDIFIPQNVVKKLFNKGKISKRIKLIKGSSTDIKVFEKIKKIISNKKCLIILDSDHTEKHVLKELEFYSRLLKKNCYLIVCDTIIKYIKPNKYRIREWSKLNNPYTAVKKFLKNNREFILDKYFNKKLLISCNYNGFIKKVK
jgi:cephalosporin hydroxylase